MLKKNHHSPDKIVPKEEEVKPSSKHTRALPRVVAVRAPIKIYTRGRIVGGFSSPLPPVKGTRDCNNVLYEFILGVSSILISRRGPPNCLRPSRTLSTPFATIYLYNFYRKHLLFRMIL